MNVLNLTKGLAITMFTLVAFTLTSCKKDVKGCMDATSDNFNAEATIDDGSCVLARAKFIGSYLMTLSCNGEIAESYVTTIAVSDTAEDEVLITNVDGWGEEWIGKVAGNKVVVDGNVDGDIERDEPMEGVLVDRELTFTYSYTFGDETTNCNIKGNRG